MQNRNVANNMRDKVKPRNKIIFLSMLCYGGRGRTHEGAQRSREGAQRSTPLIKREAHTYLIN